MNVVANIDARRIGQVESGDSSKARLYSLKEGDFVRVRIQRFDPARDERPSYDEHEVPYSKKMRVLDVLNYISEDMESDFAYRWYCGVKKCGTCAVRMNGREVLACWESAEPDMVIEPLRHVPIVRDLVVDRAPYEKLLARLLPWLDRKEKYSGWPERISHRDMKPATEALNCLSCMACMSACPVLDLGTETNFSGPAPLVQLAQVALNCVSCYKCEEVCPVGIPIVSGIIEPLKAMAATSRPASAKHALVFSDIIERRGKIDPSELVLRTQGFRAVGHLGRVIRLLLRGKIYPLRMIFGKPVAQIEKIKNLFERTGQNAR